MDDSTPYQRPAARAFLGSIAEIGRFGTFAWQCGAVQSFPDPADPEGQQEPLSRVPPPQGQFGLRWDHPKGKFWLEAACTITGQQDRLPPRDVGDTDRIPQGGTPGWHRVDLRGGWKIKEGLNLWMALENVTNQNYRIHGSGVNEPGINYIVGVKWDF